MAKYESSGCNMSIGLEVSMTGHLLLEIAEGVEHSVHIRDHIYDYEAKTSATRARLHLDALSFRELN